jgi:hypothetical protein
MRVQERRREGGKKKERASHTHTCIHTHQDHEYTSELKYQQTFYICLRLMKYVTK